MLYKGPRQCGGAGAPICYNVKIGNVFWKKMKQASLFIMILGCNMSTNAATSAKELKGVDNQENQDVDVLLCAIRKI